VLLHRMVISRMPLLDTDVGLSPLTIRLFGGFEVEWNGAPLPPLRTQKGKWLLALLALYQGRALEREWVAERLWPDSFHPRENLKRCLTDLRAALGPHAGRLVNPSRNQLAFDASDADIDVVHFDTAIAEAKRFRAVSPLRRAVTVYRGPLLLGWTAEWIDAEREWRAQALLAALETLGEQAVEEGAYADGLVYAGRALGIDPLLDSAYRIAMRAHAGRNDITAVSQTFRQLEDRLRHEFADESVSPDPLTRSLYDALLEEARGHQAVVSLPSDQPRHNLPAEARPLIGRVTVRAALTELIREGSRLVTVTGIGGMGKSRLARQVGFDLVGDFPEGVWLIDCHALREREDVLTAICAALHVKPGSRGSEQTLHRTLKQRKMLLILDGFEAVVAHAACLEALLSQASHMQCLVTSRQSLGLAREVQVPLDPMSASQEDPEEAEPAEGVALFGEAVGHVVAGFRVNDANRDIVEQICEQLDGIPLAIILAAGFLRTLSLVELLNVVQQRRFHVLRRRAVGEEDRHADLQRVIAESILALETAEQRCLQRMSIFVGGFDYTAALQVCAADEDDGSELLALLGRFHDHSLLVRRGEPPRLHLLDTVRECLAARNLQGDPDASVDGEMADCRFRHAAHYVPIAHRIHALIVEQGDWGEGIELLWRDIGNLRAAIAYCIAAGRDDLLIEYAWTLARTLAEMGLRTDFLRLAEAAEKAAERHDRPDILANMLSLRGVIARREGQEEHARDCWERRLELLRQIGSPSEIADVLFDLAGQAQSLGDQARCKALLVQELRLARAHKLQNELATGYVMAAYIAFAEGRPRKAILRARTAQRVVGKGVNRVVAVYVSAMLGKLYVQLDDVAQAEALLRQAIAAGLEGKRAFEVGYSLLDIGALYERQGRVRLAALAFLAACRIHTQFASPMQDLAEDILQRFRQAHAEPDLLEWMNRKQRSPWMELTTTLLQGS
jgi:predicted ATPase/DNA-binding SARP family transcriptional activator